MKINVLLNDAPTPCFFEYIYFTKQGADFIVLTRCTTYLFNVVLIQPHFSGNFLLRSTKLGVYGTCHSNIRVFNAFTFNRICICKSRGLYLFFRINIERQMIYNAHILDYMQSIKLLLPQHPISVVKCE